jgi:hypothetical protein
MATSALGLDSVSSYLVNNMGLNISPAGRLREMAQNNQIMPLHVTLPRYVSQMVQENLRRATEAGGTGMSPHGVTSRNVQNGMAKQFGMNRMSLFGR